jgi:hypothetical protein
MEQLPHPVNTHARAEVNRQERSPYVAPALEPLGNWRALTLQQSVGVAGFLLLPLDVFGTRYGESW